MKKKMSDFVLDMKDVNLQKDNVDQIFKQINDYVEMKKTEILLAWWAEYGLAPNEVELIYQSTPDGFKVYFRKREV